jgi:DNA-directed RNA polymerase subunit RPC12/RpoP
VGKKCLRCGYERQSTDMAPDYECPRCGAIYSKVEAIKKERESELKQPEKLRVAHEKAFFRFFRKHPVIFGGIALLCVLVCAGVIAEHFMASSLEAKSKAFQKNLSMTDKESFERSLHDLMDIAETAHKRLSRHSLSSDLVADHALCVMDRTLEFVDRMRLAADGEPLLYDYNVGRTEQTLYGNLKLILDQVKDEKARAIQRLILLNLRGVDLQRKMTRAGREIVRPGTESGERAKEDEKEYARHKLEMAALRQQCEKGNTYACEALEDMQRRGNQAGSSHASDYRLWQAWAQTARQRARDINDDFETDVSIQTWNGEWVEINRDNVEEIIERERPAEP